MQEIKCSEQTLINIITTTRTTLLFFHLYPVPGSTSLKGNGKNHLIKLAIYQIQYYIAKKATKIDEIFIGDLSLCSKQGRRWLPKSGGGASSNVASSILPLSKGRILILISFAISTVPMYSIQADSICNWQHSAGQYTL